jgi:hypothetical protein
MKEEDSENQILLDRYLNLSIFALVFEDLGKSR